jgi:hypothetical protein
MDFDFWLKVFRGGYKMVGIDEVLAIFRVHPESKTYHQRPDERWARENFKLFLRHRPELRTFVGGVYYANYGLYKLFSYFQNKLLLKHIKKFLKCSLLSVWIPFYGRNLVKHINRQLSIRG